MSSIVGDGAERFAALNFAPESAWTPLDKASWWSPPAKRWLRLAA